jgi:uncharacterized protein YacL
MVEYEWLLSEHSNPRKEKTVVVFSAFIRSLFILSFIFLGYTLLPFPVIGTILGGVLAIGLVGAEYWWSRKPGCSYKVLDTSVIIDGRITDICKTNIIEGSVIVPGFVLHELQRISDSTDELKRNRGRRGLNTLAELKKMSGLDVQIRNQDFPEVPAVDEKLLRLAKRLKGKLVTNDINLNKVASLQGIPVLNINDLSNAVKTVVLPGEEMMIRIIKEGKESGQGVGYLEDGTMVVVENGRQWLNQKQVVSVTSVLQTAAGRMVFAKRKSGGNN